MEVARDIVIQFYFMLQIRLIGIVKFKCKDWSI